MEGMVLFVVWFFCFVLFFSPQKHQLISIPAEAGGKVPTNLFGIA